MSGIPEAIAVIFTTNERAELEGLARATRTEHRLRQRARIVLLAAKGTASRAIGREVGCTTGTADVASNTLIDQPWKIMPLLAALGRSSVTQSEDW